MLIILDRCFLDSNFIKSMELDSSGVIKVDYLKHNSDDTYEFNLHFENRDDARAVFYKISSARNRDCDYMLLDKYPVKYDKDTFKNIVLDELTRGVEEFVDNLDELREHIKKDKDK